MPELQPTPEFYQYQQKTTDYFDQYRRGSLKPWEETSKRKDIYRKIRFPKPGRWPGYLPGQGHATGYHYLDALPQGWYDYGMKAVEQRDWREVAKQALEAKPFFEKVEPHGMVFKKILGWGGYGLVALAEYRDELGNKIGNMVVKMNKRPEGRHAMTRERESHSVFHRARHITKSYSIRKRLNRTAQTPNDEDNRGQVGNVPQVGQVEQAGTVEQVRPIGQGNGQERKDPNQLNKQSMPIQVKPVASDGSDEAVARLASELEKLLEQPPRVREEDQRGGEGRQPQVSGVSTLRGREDEFATDPDILVFEHMERGDLASWIGKAVSNEEDFPDYALWCIFHCLAKGMIGMLHPPKFYQHDYYYQTGGYSGPAVDEKAPVFGDKVTKGYVHFDLDPTNVLVGDFTDPTEPDLHKAVPLVKIADLGLGELTEMIQDDPFEMWTIRRRGKPNGYLVPEQIHPEWDHIKISPKMEPIPPKVAGQFSYKSNVFSIGLIMWQLITKLFPTHPTALCSVQGAPFTEEADLPGPVKWTHGGLLMSRFYDRFQHRLKVAILWCMMDQPDDRPEPHQLEREIRRGLEETKSADNKDIAWGREFFTKPPPAKGPEMVKSLPLSWGEKEKDPALMRLGVSAPVRPEFSATTQYSTF